MLQMALYYTSQLNAMNPLLLRIIEVLADASTFLTFSNVVGDVSLAAA